MRQTDAQLVKLIHIALAELRIDDDGYRTILGSRYNGATSCKQLTYRQKSDLLDYFKNLGFGIRRKPASSSRCNPCLQRKERPQGQRPPDSVLYPVTAAEKRDIAQLRDNITWKIANGFERWLLKYFHVFKVDNSLVAGKVIQALRAMCQQQNGCQCDGICTRHANSARPALRYVKGGK